MRIRGPLADRLASGVVVDAATGCHNWTRSNVRGYGLISNETRVKQYTHRVAYALANGGIPAGYQVDHLCRNPSCCNPAHLEAVTPAENTARSTNKGGVALRTGKCWRGHDDWAVQGAKRYCRECQRESKRRGYRRSREALQETSP